MATTHQDIENHLHATEARWFAVYTKFKSEKFVCAQLQRKGIECYVPINRLVREYTRKRKVVELPLIHCYVFVRIVKEQYVSVLETSHVFKFIRFSRNLISIPNQEIDLLRRICQEQMDLHTAPLEFSAGRLVEVIGGNLTGVRGKLIEHNGRNFVVELDHVGIGLHMEIDRQLLRPMGSSVDLEMSDAAGLWSRQGW
ncbi:MAG: UpxY family transcription antiterminator [Saprospiraceae bacterium]|nr:UpxY family transcription antiterminator [Saprospiraceae bacterium]